MKAAVLPVPVWAIPSRSLPLSRIGIACSWIGVEVEYSFSASAWRTGCDSPRFSKDMVTHLYRAAPPRSRNGARKRGGFLPTRVKREDSQKYETEPALRGRSRCNDVSLRAIWAQSVN